MSKDTGTTEEKKPKADKAKKEKPKPIQSTILAKHTFTDSELAEQGNEVGRLHEEARNLTMDLAAISKDYKGRIDLKQAAISLLATKLANRYEMRETLTHVIYDTKNGTKSFVDPKDYKKVFKTDKMTESDWQLPMFAPAVLAETKKKPEQKKEEAKAKGQPEIPPIDATLHEAASAAERVELDLDVAISEGIIPSVLVKNFRALAKKAKWAQKVINGVSAYAMEHDDKGVSAVADCIRPYCILK